ncbi:SLC13 family permease [Enterococcus songbeiensis]
MDQAVLTLLIMVATAVMLLLELIPPAATAFLCALSLTLSGILTPQDAFKDFANINIILFGAMFVIGHAVFSVGIATDLGNLIKKYADNEKKLVLAILLVAGSLSAFLSNTSTSAIFLPLIIGLAAGSGYSKSKLLYTMMVAVGMGGSITFLGGPGWLFAKAQIEASKPGTLVSMFEIAKVTLPLFIISVIYMLIIGYKLIPNRQSDEEQDFKEEKATEIPAWHKKFVAVITLLTVLGMLFSAQININAAIIAVIGALALVLSGVIKENEAYRVISWKTLFLFGGILPLSTALEQTGAGEMIANFVLKIMGGTTNPFIITAVCMIVPCVLSQFLSNTTCMAIFTPLGISIAHKIGADPTAVIMAISIGACLAITTPIGQPGNAMIYGPSGLKFADYAKPGVPLTAILLVVSIFLIPIVWPFFG